MAIGFVTKQPANYTTNAVIDLIVHLFDSDLYKQNKNLVRDYA